MARGDFDEATLEAVRDVVARLGLAEVAACGLTGRTRWELLVRRGYRARISLTPILEAHWVT